MDFSLSFIDLITATFIEKNLVKNLDTVVIVQTFGIDIGKFLVISLIRRYNIYILLFRNYSGYWYLSDKNSDSTSGS